MKIRDLFRRKPKPVSKSYVPTDQGWLNTSWDWGWWQQDLQPKDFGGINEVVEACISALSQTVAMLPAHHLTDEANGEAKRSNASYQEKVLLNPNRHTTRSRFFNNIIRSMYFEGNGYALATRDGNRSVNALYLLDPKNVSPVQDPESGDVFYWVSPNNTGDFNPDTDNVHPERDILHLRINVSDREPLKGISPLTSAINSLSANQAITGHQAKFFGNMARPSGVLSTDQQLTRDQMLQIRDAVAKQTQGNDSGKVPILGNGLKWESMALTSQDAQMVEALGMTIGNISRVFRVPLPVINDMQGSTFNNASALMDWFLASGLGFLLEHIELELNKLFGLPFNERINFDTKILLRSDWKTQIDTLGEGVLKGIYSPNEARSMVGLGAVKDGDEPRVQQQVVPLTAWDQSANEPAPVPDDVAASLSKGFTSYGR